MITTMERPGRDSPFYPQAEDFNQPSEARERLLEELKELFDQKNLHPWAVTWAACYVMPIERHQRYVELSRIEFLGQVWNLDAEPFQSAIAYWTQKARTSAQGGSTTAPPSPRNSAATTLAKQRERWTCPFTGTKSHLEAAHIVPPCLFKDHSNREEVSPQDKMSRFLCCLCGECNQGSAQWIQKIQELAGYPNNKRLQSQNLISVNGYIRDLWNCGCIALKPIGAPDRRNDGSESLRVQFFWQAPFATSKTRSFAKVPKSTEGYHGFYNENGEHEEQLMTYDRDLITTGDIFTFHTANPSTHPLPDWNLLELAWHLNRIVAMKGGAESCADDDSEGDSTAERAMLWVEGSMCDTEDQFGEAE